MGKWWIRLGGRDALIQAVRPVKSKDAQLRLKKRTQDVVCSRQSEGQGITSPLATALRSWIQNCLVPVLMDKYVAEQRIKTEVALGYENVRDSTEMKSKSSGCNVQ